MNKTSKAETVRVLNAVLGWRIDKTPKGFDLYDEFGFSGTFATEAAALRQFNAPYQIIQ